jgi:hypothetical protein
LLVVIGASGCSSKKPVERELPPAIEQSVELPPALETDTVPPPGERELYEAAVSAAAPGAAARDTREARALFDQLLELYPDTPYAPEVDAFRAFLDREDQLRRQIRVLESELEQLKAIDFGQAAEPDSP